MTIEQIIAQYGDPLFRLCYVMLKNESDAEDAVQETFIQYYQKAPDFTNREHEKAWLFKVATNKCRDQLRFRSRHSHVDLDSIQACTPEVQDKDILIALMELPEKYRLVLTLHYVEGYTTAEIANIIGKSPSAVKMRLQAGRKQLEELYRKEYL